MSYIEVNIIEILEILVAYQGFSFAFFLLFFKPGQKRLSNQLLAALSLTFGVHFLTMFFVEKRLFGIVPNVNPFCEILYLPLIYFYAKSLIYKNYDTFWTDAKRHFLYNLPLIAYAIQEWIGLCKISKIKGTYANIMGLPVQRVYEELQRF